ncbi:Os12g0572601 [Oryza sativa Japonica Group]|uniref:Uncharacterized protein n=2 Tax=Oryza sativa subsp. japonica TaxID=39947 RepID=A0A8J8XJ28_ORYSJ|nr:hypothetical protein OsJ_36597 [Oryza sativa Japonica Group]KAB8117930.1 hypothetical protein EE612_060421 [Oryza sativa]BAT17753.1 Os12g0572601 [Oryza sativa Japonica Group]
MSVHSDSVRQSRRRSELNRLGSSCMYTYLPAHLSLLAGRPRRGGGGGGDVDGGGGDASMIGGGGGVSPARCTGNVTAGRKPSRRTATSGDGEGKKKSTHTTQDAGMISGARHRPVARSAAADPCEPSMAAAGTALAGRRSRMRRRRCRRAAHRTC